jgi:hypothetical protein
MKKFSLFATTNINFFIEKSYRISKILRCHLKSVCTTRNVFLFAYLDLQGWVRVCNRKNTCYDAFRLLSRTSSVGTCGELRNPIMTPIPTESESESVMKNKFRSRIGVKVITTSDKVLRFYEPVTLFFISINIKKDNTYYID